jgi:hypothetical protein
VSSNSRVQPWNKGLQSRLAALGEKKPERKAAQIRALWPDIKLARDKGHSLKAICDCLEAEGIQVTVTTLGSYITRMRRTRDCQQIGERPATGSVLELRRPPLAARDLAKPESGGPRDPLLNLRKRENPIFDYRPELADPKKLI